MRTPSPAAHWLSAAALAGAAAASAVILLWKGAFPDPVPAPAFNGILAEARGWSAVTLLLAVPLGALAQLEARSGSLRARLVWAGVMTYLVYTFLELSVSGPFTPLFLVYVATYAAALPALVMVAASVDVAALPAAFGDRAPRRLLAIFGFVIAAGVGAAWLKGIAGKMAAGQYGWPTAYGSVEQVVRALDLGLQVPLGIAAGVLLWRRKPAGYLVGALLAVMGACMGFALAGMVGASLAVEGKSVTGAAPFAVLGAVATAIAIPYFRSIREPGEAGAASQRGGTGWPERPAET